MPEKNIILSVKIIFCTFASSKLLAINIKNIMNLVEYIAENAPITNLHELPGLIGLQHDNPIGLPLWLQLAIIFVLAEVMAFVNYRVRYKGDSSLYPLLYTLLGVTLLACGYYCFQCTFPEYKVWNDLDPRPFIGWFCMPSIVGWPLALLLLLLLTHVIFCIISTIMQTVAQLNVEASFTENKPWKEWKVGVFIMTVAALLTTVALFASYTTSSWLLIVGEVVIVLFVLYKIIADTVRSRKFGWSLLTGLVFFAGIEVCYMLTLECLRGCVIFIVILSALLSQAKARKKKAYKEDSAS